MFVYFKIAHFKHLLYMYIFNLHKILSQNYWQKKVFTWEKNFFFRFDKIIEINCDEKLKRHFAIFIHSFVGPFDLAIEIRDYHYTKFR